MHKHYDVIVAGAGPAGLAIASALGREGLSIVCVDSKANQPWENNTCAWADEIRPLGLDKYCDRIWPKIEIIFAENSRKVLVGAYAHFDNGKLRNALRKDIEETIAQETIAVAHDAKASTVTLKNGDKLRAIIVVDATGHAHRLMEKPTKEADSFQNVLGILARVEKHPYNLEHMILMDFRSGFLGKKNHPPTFLYAMPFAPDLAFFEETSLADNPGVPFDLLRERLHQRLEHMKIKILKVENNEEGALAMNPVVPDLKQRVIGYGLAGGFVHAATGWSVARSLAQAGPAARSIAEGIRAGQPPDSIADQTYKLLWPPEILRMRKIHKSGGEFFTKIGLPAQIQFFKFFFSFPGTMWNTYLSWNSTLMKVNRSLFIPPDKNTV